MEAKSFLPQRRRSRRRKFFYCSSWTMEEKLIVLVSDISLMSYRDMKKTDVWKQKADIVGTPGISQYRICKLRVLHNTPSEQQCWKDPVICHLKSDLLIRYVGLKAHQTQKHWWFLRKASTTKKLTQCKIITIWFYLLSSELHIITVLKEIYHKCMLEYIKLANAVPCQMKLKLSQLKLFTRFL